MQYSHSKLSCFENCPQAYKFQYIDKLEVEAFESIEAFMGSRVHDVLEKFYKDRQVGKIASLDEVLGYYNELWRGQITPDIVVNAVGLTPDHYRITGEKCLAEYYSRYKPFSKGKTIATEMKVNLDLLGDKKYIFIGYIDRLDSVTDGVYEIHDYKTGRSLPTQDKQDRDRQLALYEIGVRQMWQDVKEVDLVWHYLMFDKEIRSKRTHEHLSQLKQDLLEVIKQIEKATKKEDFPAVESGLCGWCAYQDHCKLKKHQVKAKQLPLNKYLEEEGVVLANKYAELKAKEKEFTDWYDQECAQLSEALIAYAKKEGVEYVYGTDKRVGIKFGEAYRFPKTGTEERTKLETYLKEKGLWETYSMLNTRALDKALKDDETDPKIKKYAKKEETTTIRLNKIKERE